MSEQVKGTQEQTIKMLAKIVAKTLGNPKKGAALDNEEQFVVLGQVFGIVDGVKQKEDPLTGKIYYPLAGRFQAVCMNGDIVRSGLLYLPGGIHDSYESAARSLQDGDTMQFAIELRSRKSTNAAGYCYEAKDLVPRKIADELDTFMTNVLQPQLPAPTPVEEAPAEPAKEEHKKSKK